MKPCVRNAASHIYAGEMKSTLKVRLGEHKQTVKKR